MSDPAPLVLEGRYVRLEPLTREHKADLATIALDRRNAFERMGCIRVQFRVNAPNARSRRAVVRLGAQMEGILRHHTIRADGQLVDWVYYSILREEWPTACARIEEKLARHATA